MILKKLIKLNIYNLILISSTSLMIAGCGADENNEDTSASDDTPRMIERQAPQRQESRTASSNTRSDEEDDFRVMPKIDGSLEEDGMGLETIIDASNKQAYADSLQWIAEDVSKQQFDRLESSIRYIHMYDSSVLGSESKLLTLIDGKTGQEIIAHAEAIRNQRRGN